MKRRRDVLALAGAVLAAIGVPVPGAAGMVLSGTGAAFCIAYFVAVWRGKRG